MLNILENRVLTKEEFHHEGCDYVFISIPVFDFDKKLIMAIVCICPVDDYTDEMFGALKILSKTIIKDLVINQKKLLGNYERAIIQSISDGFMIVDKNGIISFLNDKALEILGVDRGAIGKNLREITDFEPELFEVIKTGKGWVDKEFIIDMKNKKNIHLLKTAIPVTDEYGEVLLVIDTFKD